MVSRRRCRRRQRKSPLRWIIFLACLIAGIFLYHQLHRPPVYVWIYDLNRAKAQTGSLEAIVKKVSDNGCSGLIVCSNRGDHWLTNKSDFKELCKAAHEQGLSVTGYARGLATNPTEEGRVAAEAKEAGADDFILDMESEYKTPTGKEDAKTTAKIVAETFGRSKLGFTSFGLPSYHKEFPWATLKEICSYTAPQWYTSSWQHSQKWSFEQGLKKIRKEFSCHQYPLAPVLQAYGKNSGFEYVEPEELRRMLRFSQKMDVISISIFRYELMDETHWRVIKEFTSGF